MSLSLNFKNKFLIYTQKLKIKNLYSTPKFFLYFKLTFSEFAIGFFTTQTQISKKLKYRAQNQTQDFFGWTCLKET